MAVVINIKATINRGFIKVLRSSGAPVSPIIKIVKKGPKGDPGDLSSIVYAETPTGLMNGVNATFNTAFSFLPATVQVYLNGILLRIIDDYQLIGTTTIQLVASPGSSEKLSVNYIKQ